jgi:hypothetical protein
MNRLFRIISLLLALAACAFVFKPFSEKYPANPPQEHRFETLTDLKILQDAFEQQNSNVQVRQTGQIVKVLKDDNHGSRHQRFVVLLESGQKILIAHNTDLAPRIESLQTGAPITFFGEYEWNNKGGVVHWTHRDPKGKHPDGWLRYDGRTYD